jgi:L-malate glycosyltransferase
MNILFLTPWYPTKDSPVTGTFIQEHAKAISMSNDVVVIHYAGIRNDIPRGYELQADDDLYLCQNIKTIRLWVRLCNIPIVRFLYFDYCIFGGIKKIITDGFYPDIIHCNIFNLGLPALLAGKVFNIPVVMTEHCSYFGRSVLNKINILKASMVYKNVKRVYTVSKELEKAIKSYGIKGNFHVVPNAVDNTIFFPDINRNRDRKKKRLIFVGSLDFGHNKGLPILFASLHEINKKRDDWHLDIVGDGPRRSEFVEQARSLGINQNITFHGYLDKQKIASLMRDSDLFLLPSYFETFSVATVEALMTGLPVIATKCGGPEEFVTEENGILIPVGDIKNLFQAINWMMDRLNHFSPLEISERAVQKFSLTNVATLYQESYMELTNK